MKYVVASILYDEKWKFDTEEEARAQIKQFVADDKVEFGIGSENDYYIVIEDDDGYVIDSL